MKRNLVDRVIGFFSPSAEAMRMQERLRIYEMSRYYDVAKSFPSSDWVSISSNSANSELKAAIKPAREKARALSQNAPYGVKATDVIVTEIVGAGILPEIKGRTKSQTKKLQEAWSEWAETTNCDYFGQNNYYALQELAARSTAEAGESICLKDYRPGEHLKLKLIESDYINTDEDDVTKELVQGVQLKNGQRVHYHIFKSHPGDENSETIKIDAKNIAHVYRQKRPGQVRGISWAHAVIEKMKDFDDYQYATLVAKKSQACLTGVITTNGNEGLNLSPSALKEKREAELAMRPGYWRILKPGEDMKTVSPPSNTDYANFNRETLRAIAAAWGISYEALTGDYSQSNYSSSRMGQKQMQKNVEAWRWNMFIPQFCVPTFQWFLEYCATVKGLDVRGVTAEWVPPAYTYIDPTKEIQAKKDEIRSGLISWKKAVRETGQDPERVLEEIAESNARFDELGIVLDVDPRKVTMQGMMQSQSEPADPNQEEQNNGEEVSAEKNNEEDSEASDES